MRTTTTVCSKKRHNDKLSTSKTEGKCQFDWIEFHSFPKMDMEMVKTGQPEIHWLKPDTILCNKVQT